MEECKKEKDELRIQMNEIQKANIELKQFIAKFIDNFYEAQTKVEQRSNSQYTFDFFARIFILNDVNIFVIVHAQWEKIY